MDLAYKPGDAGGDFGYSATRHERQTGCGRPVSGDARRNCALPGGLGATSWQERENHLRAKDPGKREGQRRESEAGIRQVFDRQELRGTGGKIKGTVRSSADLRFGRWRHDRGNVPDGSAMEGGHVKRRCSLASVFFRSA